MVMLLLALTVGLAACDPTDTRWLPALLEDPMAHLDLPGTELIRRWETPEGEHLFGRSSAGVRQVFRILEADNADGVLLDAIAYAESVGWVFDEDQPSPFGDWEGRKTVDEGEMGVLLSLGSDGGPTLNVSLDYMQRFR